MRRLLKLVGITPESAKIEISNTVKFTKGDGEMIETNKPITATRVRYVN
jgi:hypothetical protein